MEIKVSIIVPVYNTESFLKKCLNSLISQSLKEIEIILINDCSTDNSFKILQEYKKNYPNNIVIIDLTTKKGPGGARNEGLKIAKGNYIAFVDSDDDVETTMFENLYNIAKNNNYDMVDCAFYYEALDEVFLTTSNEALGELNINKRKELILHSGFIWSKIYKKAIITENNIKFRYNVAYEDIDFLRIFILHCNKVGSINKVLYNHRINNNSLTQLNNNKIKIDDKILSMKALFIKFSDLSFFDEYKDELTYLVYKTYMVLLDYVIKLNIYKEDSRIFKKLHDFFKELVIYDYHSNKYILKIKESDRVFAEINNNDCNKLTSILTI